MTLTLPFSPRAYQQKASENIQAVYNAGHRQFIWTGATGAGKTIIGANETLRFANMGMRGAWLVHKEEILIQTIKKLVTYGFGPGIIRGKESMIDSRVFVAMVQTLSRGERLQFLIKNGVKFDYIVIDEAHHGGANQWIMVVEALKKANPDILILGLTATPQRTDKIGLKQVGYTSLINGPQYEDLLNPAYTGGEIYLTPPLVVFSPLTQKLQSAKRKKGRKGDLDKKAEQEIFSEKVVVEDCVQLYNKYFNGAPCIIFGASVEDCINVSARLNAEGWKGGAVYDKMDSEDRKELIDGLGNGKYNFLCSYEILGEGVDVPVVAGAIKRRRTNSIIIEMQQNGRPARKYPGKKYNLIIDQCGNSLIHGHPLTRREWTLEGLKKQPSEENIVMTVCPGCNCYLQGKPDICPYCGENLKNKPSAGIEEIVEVPAPMEILPAPAYSGMADIAEIQEFAMNDRELAIYNKVKNGQMTSFDRFGELAKLLGKDDKWVKLVWGKYYE
jgi:superfamily II DNA or RNA helicase